jgi:hypothetical protein
MIKLNGLIHIENKYVEMSPDFALKASVSGGGLSEGVYKVIQMTHEGGTGENDWYTEFVGIAQPGTVPVTGDSFNK